MNERPQRSAARRAGAYVRIAVVGAVVSSVVAMAGCGSDQPGYCQGRASLQNSVKGLTSLNASSGVSGLKAQVSKVQGDASALVNSAKSDFPSETSAISSSVNALKSSVTALPSTPTAAQIATVTKDAPSVVTSVENFMDASNSRCG